MKKGAPTDSYAVGMRVIRQDTPGSYHVPSERKKGITYAVDVLGSGGEGHCTCDDWMIRIGPYLERHEDPPRRFCKHIAACRDDFLDFVISQYLHQTTGQPAQPWKNSG